MGARVMESLLNASDLTVGYSKKAVLEALHFDLRRGELVSLIGLNGSGKSTLMRTIAGLQPALAGDVRIEDRSVMDMSSAERARLISVVLTGRPRVGLLDVYTLISLGRQPWTDNLGRMKAEDLRKVEEAMAATETRSFASRSILSLSDGELQKVMIARALAQDTPLMLLDEPTAFLDLVNRVKIMRLLKEIVHRMKKTALISTHDLQTALAISDRIMIVHEGKLWAGTPDQARNDGVLQRAFGDVDLLFAR